jgi:amino acid transporter
MEKHKRGMTSKKLLLQTLIFALAMYIVGYLGIQGNPNSLKFLTGIAIGSLVFLAFMSWVYKVNPFKFKTQTDTYEE